MILTTAVITTGAHRNALLAAGYDTKQLPPTAPLLYGAFFTSIVLLLYIPLYLAHSNSAARYVDLAYPLPEDGRPGKEWAEGRTVLGGVLGQNQTFTQHLTTAFGVLAPFASSLIGTFFK